MAMIYVNYEKIDRDYLIETADEEGTKDELIEFMKKVKEKLDE